MPCWIHFSSLRSCQGTPLSPGRQPAKEFSSFIRSETIPGIRPGAARNHHPCRQEKSKFSGRIWVLLHGGENFVVIGNLFDCRVITEHTRDESASFVEREIVKVDEFSTSKQRMRHIAAVVLSALSTGLSDSCSLPSLLRWTVRTYKLVNFFWF